MNKRSIRFAAIGLNHNHIYGQTNAVPARRRRGARRRPCRRGRSRSKLHEGFPQAKRVGDVRAILEDPSIQLVVSAITPDERGDIAIRIMRHGKDVMVDKPGTITLEKLAEIRAAQAETKRIWSVCYSERFETRSTVKASELVGGGPSAKSSRPSHGPACPQQQSVPTGSSSASATAASSLTSPRINATSSCISLARPRPRWWPRHIANHANPGKPSSRISAR